MPGLQERPAGLQQPARESHLTSSYSWKLRPDFVGSDCARIPRMAVPWLTVGRLVLDNLDTIIGVVRPAFTRKKAEAIANQAEVVSQQIAELQAAVATNAEQIKDLAEQLKNVVT